MVLTELLKNKKVDFFETHVYIDENDINDNH